MITDNVDKHRFEITADGQLAGFAEYRDRGSSTRAFTHTEIKPEFEGRGLASELIKAVLADARANGLHVLPYCPFVRAYIAKHRDEYVDLVPEDRRAEFDLA